MNPQIKEPGMPTHTNSDTQEFYIVTEIVIDRTALIYYYVDLKIRGVSICKDPEINIFRDER